MRPLRCQHRGGRGEHTIRIERETVDALLHQELREFRIVAGSLSADADLSARPLRRLDRLHPQQQPVDLNDGLQEDRVNRNQGAESTLAFLLSLAEMCLLESSLAAFRRAL